MNSKYAFNDIAVGDSFDVSASVTKLTSFRVYASRVGAKLGKKFSVTVDKDRDCYVCTRTR